MVLLGVPVGLILRKPVTDHTPAGFAPASAPAVQVTPKGNLISATAHATDTTATVLRWRSGGTSDTVTYLSRHNGRSWNGKWTRPTG